MCPLISFIGTLHFRHVTYTPASHRSPLLRAVRQDLGKPRCFRSRIRIIQKPDPLAEVLGRYSSIVSRTLSAITAGSSSIANVTVRSNPCGPVQWRLSRPHHGAAGIRSEEG